MFKKENIKGLSTIVATLLIVLIVLVATGIILVIIKEIIQKNKMNKHPNRNFINRREVL